MNLKYLPQLLYLMDYMNYCIYSSHLKFNLYLLEYLYHLGGQVLA